MSDTYDMKEQHEKMVAAGWTRLRDVLDAVTALPDSEERLRMLATAMLSTGAVQTREYNLLVCEYNDATRPREVLALLDELTRLRTLGGQLWDTLDSSKQRGFAEEVGSHDRSFDAILRAVLHTADADPSRRRV